MNEHKTKYMFWQYMMSYEYIFYAEYVSNSVILNNI